jgi:hypothetical protein
MQSILTDATLRHGDIVVFSEGPKVFLGHGTAGPWQLADFGGVAASRALSSKTKAAVLTLAPPASPDKAINVSPDLASLP